jgi:heme exporter protein B
MTRPGFLRASLLVAGKDLRIEWRTLETLSATGIFSMVVLVVFNFAFDATAVRELGVERLVPGLIWTVLAFASVAALARSTQLERSHNTFAALFLAPVDRGALFTGKMLANLVKLTILQALLLPLTALFFNYGLTGIAAPLLLVVFLHGLGLVQLGTLLAAVSTRLNRGEALLATLLLPAATPLLISAVKCTSGCLAGKPLAELSRWLLVAVGFDLLYFFVALMTFEFVMEECSESLERFAVAGHDAHGALVTVGDLHACPRGAGDGGGAEDLLLPRALGDGDVRRRRGPARRLDRLPVDPRSQVGLAVGRGDGDEPALLRHRARHRSDLGQAGLGHLVDLGGAADDDARPLAAAGRLPDGPQLRGQPAPRRAAGGDRRDRRGSRRADHPQGGGVVARPAPAGLQGRRAGP